jgi:hypothetical protein
MAIRARRIPRPAARARARVAMPRLGRRTPTMPVTRLFHEGSDCCGAESGFGGGSCGNRSVREPDGSHGRNVPPIGLQSSGYRGPLVKKRPRCQDRMQGGDERVAVPRRSLQSSPPPFLAPIVAPRRTEKLCPATRLPNRSPRPISPSSVIANRRETETGYSQFATPATSVVLMAVGRLPRPSYRRAPEKCTKIPPNFANQSA